MTALALRPPREVMRLSRLGVFFPTRLSFARTLIRRLQREAVRVERRLWRMDDEGIGEAVYSLRLGGRFYSLVVFTAALEPSQRTDRVIAEAWDATFVLYDGVPDEAELSRLRENVPRQEAGRYGAREWVLSRANRSVRLFDRVVDSLASGVCPEVDELGRVGYLMRTTAVYGNGKFGIADRTALAVHDVFAPPFQAEMLTVWLIRGFTFDWAEHIAFARSPETAVRLSPSCRRVLGIGNSTGLGMAPFLIRHPALIHCWMRARETALARVAAVPRVDEATYRRLLGLLERAIGHFDVWETVSFADGESIARLREEAVGLADGLRGWADDLAAVAYPWRRLLAESRRCSEACQEFVIALLLEPHGDLVDDLAMEMSSDDEYRLLPGMTVGELLRRLRRDFDWALAVDFSEAAAVGQFWYVSENKLEPRLGSRFEEAGEDWELPLDVARRVCRLAADLVGRVDEGEGRMTVADFLARCPEHRYAVRRVQNAESFPYAEIRDNLIGEDCRATDLLRCKLSFLGATTFDPKSDKWTRITLFQGAPVFDTVDAETADDWWLAAR